MSSISLHISPRYRRTLIVSLICFVAMIVGFAHMAIGDALEIPALVVIGLLVFAPAFVVGFITAIVGMALAIGNMVENLRGGAPRQYDRQ